MPRRERKASVDKMADAMDALVEARREEAAASAEGHAVTRPRRISESATTNNLLDRRRRSLMGAGSEGVDLLTQAVAQAASAADLLRTGDSRRRGSMSGSSKPKPRTRRLSNEVERRRRGSGSMPGRSVEGLVSTRRGSMSGDTGAAAAATTSLVSLSLIHI